MCGSTLTKLHWLVFEIEPEADFTKKKGISSSADCENPDIGLVHGKMPFDGCFMIDIG